MKEKTMKNKVSRKVGLWALGTVVLTGLGYSTLVLTAKPAYADTVCEPEDCALIVQTAQADCVGLHHGGVRSVVCPLSSTAPGNNQWHYYCNDGTDVGGDCTSF